MVVCDRARNLKTEEAIFCVELQRHGEKKKKYMYIYTRVRICMYKIDRCPILSVKCSTYKLRTNASFLFTVAEAVNSEILESY